MSKERDSASSSKTVAVNKKARHQFEFLETIEAGIELRGTEVKSLRDGHAHIQEGYATIRGSEVFLKGVNIPQYAPGSYQNHEPTRPRKLLLHRREIRKLAAKIAEKRLTLVPTRIYFTRGIVKVQLALARGKVKYEKREAIKEREDRRRIDREMSRRR
ncbi:MAG TPA: SsrA-binding protein SmpB [Planctomycetota bacterium]|nr:SsrA-binding protein SmpB [Planctomycetota bacterium]